MDDELKPKEITLKKKNPWSIQRLLQLNMMMIMGILCLAIAMIYLNIQEGRKSNLDNLEQAEHSATQTNELVSRQLPLRRLVAQQRLGVQRFFYELELFLEEEEREFDQVQGTVEQLMTRQKAISDTWVQNLNPKLFQNVQANMISIQDITQEISEAIINNPNEIRQIASDSEDVIAGLINIMDQIDQRLDQVSIEVGDSVLKDSQSTAKNVEGLDGLLGKMLQNTFWGMGFLVFLIFGFQIVFLMMLRKRLAVPVRITNQLAKGDLNIQFDTPSKDEIGQLLNAMRKMLEAMQLKADLAQQIAHGDLNATVTLASESDGLGRSLQQMLESLRESAAENTKNDWLKTGQAQLSDTMRGEQDLITISQNILNHLAPYLNAQVGAFFLKDGETLRLLSSYAFKKRKNNDNAFQIGEGLVGQAGLEKKSILFSQVPEEHVNITINSGIGESRPTSILALPILLEDQLLGVLELGTFQEFTSLEMEFLEGVMVGCRKC